MNDSYISRTKEIIVGIVLVMMLQVTSFTNAYAQRCGKNYPRGGAQGGAYASGGNAKYLSTAIELSSNVEERWNMISVPLNVQDFRKEAVFPTAISAAFTYNGGYRGMDTLILGKGYWLKFLSAQTILISGYVTKTLTVPVDEGWNMIGSLSVPMPITNITSTPPGMATSEFYGYNGSYQGMDTLIPGKGYWVKVKMAGTLNLTAPPVAEALPKSAIKVVRMNEMPPPPPDETVNKEPGIPAEYALEQAFPNPFNPTTTIRYGLPSDSRVSLRVYNTLGQIVAVLADGTQQSGYKQVEWNASGNASGVYFYRLEATSVTDPDNTFLKVKEILLLK